MTNDLMKRKSVKIEKKNLYWFYPKYLGILVISKYDQNNCKSELLVPKIYEIHVQCIQ